MNISLREAADALKGAQKLVLTAHVNPDGDAVGSVLALRLMLCAMGKDVQVLLDDDIPAIFSILPGYAVIGKPAEEDAARIKADLLVVLDATPDRIGRVAERVEAPVLNIDHHVTNEGGGEGVRLYCDAARAAACEIVFALAGELGQPLTRELATCLYTGMATDTGFFRYANTTPATMRAAASLLEAGVEPNLISEALEQKPYAVVRGMAAAVERAELFHDGRAAGIFLDQAFTESVESTEGFIDAIRVIEGVDVAVLLKCKEERLCRVSMRSKGLDVARIARSFGGGGHVRAAGCTLELTFAAARDAIKAAIDAALSAEEGS